LGTLNENSKHAWWGGGAARGTRAGDDNAAAGRDRDGGEACVPASLGREFSTRGAGRAPSRVPRHTITSSNFLVVGDLARKNRGELESGRAHCRFWTHGTSSRVRPHPRADPVARGARRAEGAGRISLARSLVAPAAISALGCSGERTGGARRRSPSAFGVNGSLTRPRRRLLARRHGSPPGRRGHS
jgi:hypothetical protein